MQLFFFSIEGIKFHEKLTEVPCWYYVVDFSSMLDKQDKVTFLPETEQGPHFDQIISSQMCDGKQNLWHLPFFFFALAEDSLLVTLGDYPSCNVKNSEFLPNY